MIGKLIGKLKVYYVTTGAYISVANFIMILATLKKLYLRKSNKGVVNNYGF